MAWRETQASVCTTSVGPPDRLWADTNSEVAQRSYYSQVQEGALQGVKPYHAPHGHAPQDGPCQPAAIEMTHAQPNSIQAATLQPDVIVKLETSSAHLEPSPPVCGGAMPSACHATEPQQEAQIALLQGPMQPAAPGVPMHAHDQLLAEQPTKGIPEQRMESTSGMRLQDQDAEMADPVANGAGAVGEPEGEEGGGDPGTAGMSEDAPDTSSGGSGEMEPWALTDELECTEGPGNDKGCQACLPMPYLYPRLPRIRKRLREPRVGDDANLDAMTILAMAAAEQPFSPEDTPVRDMMDTTGGGAASGGDGVDGDGMHQDDNNNAAAWGSGGDLWARGQGAGGAALSAGMRGGATWSGGDMGDDDRGAGGGEAVSGERGTPGGGSLAKRPRLAWTADLHARFVQVVDILGLHSAVPKSIMRLMNVKGLTREQIASHLQKYRLFIKKGGNPASSMSMAVGETAPHVPIALPTSGAASQPSARVVTHCVRSASSNALASQGAAGAGRNGGEGQAWPAGYRSQQGAQQIPVLQPHQPRLQLQLQQNPKPQLQPQAVPVPVDDKGTGNWRLQAAMPAAPGSTRTIMDMSRSSLGPGQAPPPPLQAAGSFTGSQSTAATVAATPLSEAPIPSFMSDTPAAAPVPTNMQSPLPSQASGSSPTQQTQVAQPRLMFQTAAPVTGDLNPPRVSALSPAPALPALSGPASQAPPAQQQQPQSRSGLAPTQDQLATLRHILAQRQQLNGAVPPLGAPITMQQLAALAMQQGTPVEDREVALQPVVDFQTATERQPSNGNYETAVDANRQAAQPAHPHSQPQSQSQQQQQVAVPPQTNGTWAANGSGSVPTTTPTVAAGANVSGMPQSVINSLQAAQATALADLNRQGQTPGGSAESDLQALREWARQGQTSGRGAPPNTQQQPSSHPQTTTPPPQDSAPLSQAHGQATNQSQPQLQQGQQILQYLNQTQAGQAVARQAASGQAQQQQQATQQQSQMQSLQQQLNQLQQSGMQLQTMGQVTVASAGGDVDLNTLQDWASQQGFRVVFFPPGGNLSSIVGGQENGSTGQQQQQLQQQLQQLQQQNIALSNLNNGQQQQQQQQSSMGQLPTCNENAAARQQQQPQQQQPNAVGVQGSAGGASRPLDTNNAPRFTSFPSGSPQQQQQQGAPAVSPNPQAVSLNNIELVSKVSAASTAANQNGTTTTNTTAAQTFLTPSTFNQSAYTVSLPQTGGGSGNAIYLNSPAGGLLNIGGLGGRSNMQWLTSADGSVTLTPLQTLQDGQGGNGNNMMINSIHQLPQAMHQQQVLMVGPQGNLISVPQMTMQHHGGGQVQLVQAQNGGLSMQMPMQPGMMMTLAQKPQLG